MVYKEMLEKGVVKNLAELARKEGLSRARVTQILNLTKLAPKIQNYLMTITDRKDLKILTERRLSAFLTARDIDSTEFSLEVLGQTVVINLITKFIHKVC